VAFGINLCGRRSAVNRVVQFRDITSYYRAVNMPRKTKQKKETYESIVLQALGNREIFRFKYFNSTASRRKV
jgi:hypothetical protein